ncbi:hypothetical protein D3C72_1556500 [compost metagenome]
MRWRLIHSAVEPLSVMATRALAPRCVAVKSAPSAMLWSMRWKVLPTKSVSAAQSAEASAAAQMATISCTVSSGNLPAAVSALSITASVPSSTALATSLTSARVGTGLVIMLSIIWVAVMTTLSISRARLIIFFCSAGTAAWPTSTARSPRATMMPSETRRMSSRCGMASARSILAIRPGRWRYSAAATMHSWRAISMSVAVLGKLTAT